MGVDSPRPPATPLVLNPVPGWLLFFPLTCVTDHLSTMGHVMQGATLPSRCSILELSREIGNSLLRQYVIVSWLPAGSWESGATENGYQLSIAPTHYACLGSRSHVRGVSHDHSHECVCTYRHESLTSSCSNRNIHPGPHTYLSRTIHACTTDTYALPSLAPRDVHVTAHTQAHK